MRVVELVCDLCLKPFVRLKKQHDTAQRIGSKKVLCSRKCVADSQKNGREFKCSACGVVVYKSPSKARRSASGLLFCSKACANGSNNSLRSGDNHPNWTNGISSYRDRALKHYGKKCSVCSYDTESVLEVHHRDGNRDHNNIENLDVLCPTHHVEFECGILSY